MNAFEEIIAGFFKTEHYWTHIGYKINLPKETKAELGKYSMPRPEIDILAYKANENKLVWVECKSYLDSAGTYADAVIKSSDRNAARYKIFTWPEFRETVSKALVEQAVRDGLALPNPILKYCLVVGRIATDKDRERLQDYFNIQGWLLYDEKWIVEQLDMASRLGWEDDVAITVAKLFSAVKRKR